MNHIRYSTYLEAIFKLTQLKYLLNVTFLMEKLRIDAYNQYSVHILITLEISLSRYYTVAFVYTNSAVFSEYLKR